MATSTWSVSKSIRLYQVNGWGRPYFDVNDAGNVVVRPNPDVEREVDLFELAKDLQARGLALPILVRFSEILANRIKAVNQAFAQAIGEYEYPGVYRGVYPVKVNPQRHVVEEIVEYGKPYDFGLEVGSKPELLIALASMRDSGGLLICNGYKDQTYIETALIAHRLNRTVIIVLERMAELPLVIKAAKRLGITPNIGVRAKLASQRHGTLVRVGRRTRQVRSGGRGDRRARRPPGPGEHARLPEAPSLPHRQPDLEHHPHQERPARSRVHLCGAREDGMRDGLPGRRAAGSPSTTTARRPISTHRATTRSPSTPPTSSSPSRRPATRRTCRRRPS